MRARTRPGRVSAVIAAITVTVLVGAPPASAATMGTPLGSGQFAAAPNNSYDCTEYNSNVVGLIPVTGSSGAPATSCIWLDTSATDPAASFAPGAVGVSTVDQVRVAVGSQTGAMEIVVMRSLYENTTTPGRPLYACCTPVGASPPFTPRAGAVTTVNIDLPMREDPTPAAGDTSTIAVWDVLALAVLEPGVPVPLYAIGDPYTVDYLWNTATPSTQTPGFSGDTSGYHVAMNADYTPPSNAAGALVAHSETKARRGSSAGRSETVPSSPVLAIHAAMESTCPIAALCIAADWTP